MLERPKEASSGREGDFRSGHAAPMVAAVARCASSPSWITPSGQIRLGETPDVAKHPQQSRSGSPPSSALLAAIASPIDRLFAPGPVRRKWPRGGGSTGPSTSSTSGSS